MKSYYDRKIANFVISEHKVSYRLMNTISIRPERLADYDEIDVVVESAFAGAEHTDGDEHRLVRRLRESAEYIPELSLVAADGDGRVLGFLMMSEITVGAGKAVALAPLAVRPDCQRRGIGSRLIAAAHEAARELGYGVSVVLGEPAYYSRFGYVTARPAGIRAPFEVDDKYFMYCKLDAGADVPAGVVRYSEAFGL